MRARAAVSRRAWPAMPPNESDEQGATERVSRRAWPSGAVESRDLIAEVPVALTFNGSTHAVMMATPADLGDFAVGFALSEGIVARAVDLLSVEVLPAATLGGGSGFEARMWVGETAMERLRARRRALAGPSGCGLCGVESLEAALPPVPVVRSHARFAMDDVMAAMSSLWPAQRLGRQTRAAHAAGLWTRTDGLVALREDVGRHNALDKLAGTLALSGIDASEAILVLTSRISVELVQKAARLGVPVLAAVSAPTTLAVATAAAAGLTLVGVARADGCEIFTHAGRLGVDAERETPA